MNLSIINRTAVSPDLITALRTINNLKSLYININVDYGRDPGIHDAAALSKLLSVIPHLERLSLHGIPEYSDLQPPALSNLHCFSLSSARINFKTYSHIIQIAKDTFKIVELFPDLDSDSDFVECLGQILDPIKDTLCVPSLVVIVDLLEFGKFHFW